MKKGIKIIYALFILFIFYLGISSLYEEFIYPLKSDNQEKNLNTPTQNKQGKIIKVYDGDMVLLLTDNKDRIKIRLYGIDCPEKGQDFSQKATNLTNSLCYNKQVIIETRGIDKYQRILGIVKIDSVDLNKELLKNGLAWQ